MKSTLKVIQEEGTPMPTEILATEIRVIGQGLRKLRKGAMNDRALLLLIHNAIPAGRRPTLTTIQAVFDGIDDLERTYLRKKQA